MSASFHPLLIAVAGGSGAGKSWLVRRLTTLLGDHAVALALDDFYLDRSALSPTEREAINYDQPAAIDWQCLRQVIADCKQGRCAEVPAYDFATHTRQDGLIPWWPRPLVFVEGLWLFHTVSVRNLFHLRIFVDCPAGIRFWRRVRRDVAERGRNPASVWQQFFRTVQPMHERFVAPQQAEADIVLPYPVTEGDVQQLAHQLCALRTVGKREMAPLRTSLAGIACAPKTCSTYD